jgi:hypothetical protein
VDWTVVQKQLQAIPADFKSQKFNSLQLVIEILSSANPQWALDEVCLLPDHLTVFDVAGPGLQAVCAPLKTLGYRGI